MNETPRVRDFYAADPVTINQDDDILRAVQVMLDHEISGLPVVDSDGRLVGILTERDCMLKAVEAGYLDEPGGRVEEYMTPDAQTVGLDDNLMDVAKRFVDSPFRRFPVVEQGRLVGIIMRRDFLRAMNPRQKKWSVFTR
jgi:predicted transcriptional regulator